MNNTEKQPVTGERNAAREYYEIKIVETGAQLFSSDYSTFNVDKKHFATLAECKSYLKEHYGKARRQRMYCDTKQGESKPIGWVYHFRNADWSHTPVVPWNQCDWVTISRIEQTEIAD